MKGSVLLAVLVLLPEIGLAQQTGPVPRVKPVQERFSPGPGEPASDNPPLSASPDKLSASPDKLPADGDTMAAVTAETRYPIPVPRPKGAVPGVAGSSKPGEAGASRPTEKSVKPAITGQSAPPQQAKPVFVLAAAKQCEAQLRKLNARFTVAKAIKGSGQCGWPRPLKLTALSRQVKVSGDIRVRCEVALALARWSKEVVVPSAKLHLGVKKPPSVQISTSYQCRRRNNRKTGKISEHGFANAVDVMGFGFPGGKTQKVADRSGSSKNQRAFQAAVRGGACAYFTTVLGPTTNASHADHFHFDLAVRRGGYRLCQ